MPISRLSMPQYNVFLVIRGPSGNETEVPDSDNPQEFKNVSELLKYYTQLENLPHFETSLTENNVDIVNFRVERV